MKNGSPPSTSLLQMTLSSSVQDRVGIRSTIAQLDNALLDITGRITQQLQALRITIEEKEKLTSLREEYARILSNPIPRVPPEIWAEVFRFACLPHLQRPRVPSDEACTLYDTLNPRHIVMTISHTCVSWRDVIQDMPEMWCAPLLRDSCDEPYRSITSLTTRLQTLAQALKHASSRPLHVTFCLMENTATTSNLVQLAMPILLHHHHRWKRLDLYNNATPIVTKPLISSISSLSITEFPLLEELNFGWFPDFDDAMPFPPVEFPMLVGSVPQLRNVSFEGRCPDPTCLPWEQFERVSFTTIVPCDCSMVLTSLTNATEIDISWDMEHAFGSSVLGDPSNPLMTSGYVLPRLQTLYVSHWDNAFFAAAKLPSLRSLHVEEMYQSDILMILDLIRRSGCSLDAFMCTEAAYGSDHLNLSHLFSSLPSLKTLRLPMADIPEQKSYLRLLMERDETGLTYCPELRTLDLNVSLWDTILPAGASQLELMMDMVELRWEEGKKRSSRSGTECGLRRLGYISEEHWERMKKRHINPYTRLRVMEREGLEILFDPQVTIPDLG